MKPSSKAIVIYPSVIKMHSIHSMPPKIEVIEGDGSSLDKAIKNVFLPKTSKTVRRHAKDIYPTKDQLLRPQNLGTSPLDLLFQEIEEKTKGGLCDISIKELFTRFSGDLTKLDESFMRRRVTVKLFDYLIQIIDVSEGIENQDRNMIKISLYDMKTLGKVFNLILILSIYPILNAFNIGIPLDQRRMKAFSKAGRQLGSYKIPPAASLDYSQRYKEHEELLSLIYSRLTEVFSRESDVKDLLLKGTGYSDLLIILAALSTIPYFSPECREKHLLEFDSVMAIGGTIDIYEVFSLIISSGSPAYYKAFILSKLELLPYKAPRNDGLLSFIEFVLGVRDDEDVNIEKFEHVSSVILRKPKSLSSVEYFSSIGSQSYKLLAMINRPIITSCVGYVIEKIWMKNNLIVRDFFFSRLWCNLNPNNESGIILVTEAEFNNAINVLLSLSKNGLKSEILVELFRPILLPLWAYLVFLSQNGKPLEIVEGILLSYFSSTNSLDIETKPDDCNVSDLDTIAKNLLFLGGDDWKFEFGPNGLTQVVRRADSVVLESTKETRVQKCLKDLDDATSCFLKFLGNLEEGVVLHLFVLVLKRWLSIYKGNERIGEINPLIGLIDMRLLEAIGSQYKESLCQDPRDIFEVVNDLISSTEFKLNLEEKELGGATGVVTEESDSDDEDELVNGNFLLEVLPSVLQLLSAILLETTVESIEYDLKATLESTIKGLDGLSNENNLKTLTKDAIQSLRFRIISMLEDSRESRSSNGLDLRSFKRAIASLNDPLVPIRAHGLYLLRRLIETKSDVITSQFVIDLHLTQLKDEDPFIYLNVIKGLQALVAWDPKIVVPILCDRYGKSNDLEERLRVGEVLLRYVQSADESFGGEQASAIVESCLAIVRVNKKDDQKIDDKVRMSAMSLLGACTIANPLGILNYLRDILDCAIGVLDFEKGEAKAIMRRAAIYLIHDLILGCSKVEDDIFPSGSRSTIITKLRYAENEDCDLMVREHAKAALKTIEDLFKLALNLET